MTLNNYGLELIKKAKNSNKRILKDGKVYLLLNHNDTTMNVCDNLSDIEFCFDNLTKNENYNQ